MNPRPPSTRRAHRLAHSFCLALLASLFTGTSGLGAVDSTEGTRPLDPRDALGTFRIRDDLELHQVVSEPLIEDPVAIDWAPDGSLWVCEMRDYPSGMDHNWRPGGRVKVLRDTDGDGQLDRAIVFLDDIPFPTGIMIWGRGVWICSAPDILWAADTDGDGRADRVEKVFTGFATDNYQARVNGLSLGLDNWIYGSSGLLGGVVRPVPNSILPTPSPVKEVNLRQRDFRFSPVSGVFETAFGVSQQGRVRDDWGEWFGCDNSRLILHYPIPEVYTRRNPNASPSQTVRHLTSGPDANRLFPASRLLERFNDHEFANRVTSAGGIGLYRDDLLGDAYAGNAFICEAVHNLVHREILEPGLLFNSRRPADERDREFLASTDNWFRPVQVRTGPDGALYIVAMYRFLIEHPRWIPAERMSRIDVRAGAGMGRIYRLQPRSKALRPIKDLTTLNPRELAACLDSPNGTERDRVHVELLTRKKTRTNSGTGTGADSASGAVEVLEILAWTASRPVVRAQALSILEGLTSMKPAWIVAGLKDPEAEVRCQVLRLSEPFLASGREATVLDAVLALKDDPSPRVIRQLAFTLGESATAAAGDALGSLAIRWLTHAEIRAAILTSASHHADRLVARLLGPDVDAADRADWLGPLVATAMASGNPTTRVELLARLLPSEANPSEAPLGLVADLLASLSTAGPDLEKFAKAHPDDSRRLAGVLTYARGLVSPQNSPATRAREAVDERKTCDALRLLGVMADPRDLSLLSVHGASGSDLIRRTALATMRRRSEPQVASLLLDQWPRASPRARADLVSVLLERTEWARTLLEGVRDGLLPASEISIEDRQRLTTHADRDVRQLAHPIFKRTGATPRAELIASYHSALEQAGDRHRGQQVFQRACASCHLVEGVGQNVGPDLRSLHGKERDYWIKNILDPSAVVEPRFVQYELELRDGRALSGLIQSESPAAVQVVSANGLSDTIARTEIESIRASTLSMMPEGLEQVVSVAEMADLLAFVNSPADNSNAKPPAADPNQVLRDPASVARLILDATQPDSVRETAIQANPQFAASLIHEMVRDLVPGTPEEYVRIPWIWRVAIACGRRNDASQASAVLEVSLPRPGADLADWQAVVVGGGIINGVSEREWPARRLDEILGGNSSLHARWNQALEQASAMADRESVPAGTRYDAVRMIGMEPWQRRGTQLSRYLTPETHPEIQFGAVSALVDMPEPEAVEALIAALPRLTPRNQKLALDGFLKTDARFDRLLAAIESRAVPRDLVPGEFVARALKFADADPERARRARALLQP